jgi:hypothetical protein
VLENRLLRRIYELMREEVKEGEKKLHVEEVHNLYFSPNIKMIKSRRTNWEWHVAHFGDMKNAHKILTEIHEGTIYLGDHGQYCQFCARL